MNNNTTTTNETPSKRQSRKLEQDLEQERREAIRTQRRRLQAEQSKKEKQHHQEKVDANRKKQEQQKQKQKQKQQQKSESGQKPKSRRGFWQKQGPYQQQPSQTSSTAGKPKHTVAEGMEKHENKWVTWIASLPRVDAAESAPFPHPKLFAMHLASCSKKDDSATLYRALMRTWHPDKFSQVIGKHLTEAQCKALYPRVQELSKQINAAFNK